MVAAIQVKQPNMFVPRNNVSRTTIGRPSGISAEGLIERISVPQDSTDPRALDIGAYSDSIADVELRDAVADVAALLSLHGNVIRDLDARRSRWRPGRRSPHPDIVLSAAGRRPQWTRSANPAVTLPVGTTARGRTLAVRLTARPGLGHTLLDLARIIDADMAQGRRV
jgi:hypothetical protein